MGSRGWEKVTAEQASKMGRRQGVRLPQKARSKYGAVKTTVDGIVFDSAKEARRYQELRLRQKAGDVRRLRCQPRYALCALVVDGADVRNVNAGEIANRRFPIAEYVADFEYDESDRGYGGVTWRVVVEDVKGVKTAAYKLKKRLFEAQYGITIREL